MREVEQVPETIEHLDFVAIPDVPRISHCFAYYPWVEALCGHKRVGSSGRPGPDTGLHCTRCEELLRRELG